MGKRDVGREAVRDDEVVGIRRVRRSAGWRMPMVRVCPQRASMENAVSRRCDVRSAERRHLRLANCWKKDSNHYNDSATSKGGNFETTIGERKTLARPPTFDAAQGFCRRDACGVGDTASQVPHRTGKDSNP